MASKTRPSVFDPGVLRLARDLRRQGIEPQRRGDRGAPRAWRPVRHGVWVRSRDWDLLSPVGRHAALVHATALVCDQEQPPVFSHESAAALWGMPRIDPWPGTVHTTMPERRVRSSGRVVRHHCQLDVVETRAGLRVTSAARTVVDLARTTTLANALAAADHGLRESLCTPDDLRSEVAAVRRNARGRARAGVVVELADGRSMSPGESLSRCQMFLLNLPRPELQVEHRDAEGLIGIVDFQWDGLVGEFDGRVKYRVGDGGTPEELAQILWREKQREDRLRRSGQRVARWVYADAVDAHRLASRLAAQGLRPQPRNDWLP